jgi:hypothetical protein
MNPTDTPKPGETPRTLAFLRLLSMLPSGSYEQFMELVEIHFGQLEREIAELQRDRERIDWLEATNQRGHYCGDFAGNLLTRAAIDRAMQPKEETKPQ